MNNFLSFLNKIKSSLWKNSSSEGHTIYSIATRSSINRRKNTRVNYPEIGAVGSLPTILFKNKALKIKDISTGGTCVIDDTNELGEVVGRTHEFTLLWNDGKSTVKGQVVGSNLNKRHIQFMNLDPRAFVKLSLLLKPGFIGSRFRKIQSGQKNFIEVSEMWVGPTGESLLFLVDDLTLSMGELARASYNDREVSIFRDSPPLYFKSGPQHIVGQRVSKAHLDDIHVLVANILNPSIRIKQLIRHMDEVKFD